MTWYASLGRTCATGAATVAVTVVTVGCGSQDGSAAPDGAAPSLCQALRSAVEATLPSLDEDRGAGMQFATSADGGGQSERQETVYGVDESCVVDLVEPGTDATAQVRLRRVALNSAAYAVCTSQGEDWFQGSLRVRDDPAIWHPLIGSAPSDCDITVVGDENTFYGRGDVLVADADGDDQVLWSANWLNSTTLMDAVTSEEVLLRSMAGLDAFPD